MKIEGTYTLDAPRDVVWPALLDPDVLSKTLPGGQDLEEVAEHQYKARMKIRVGPVQGVFSGSVVLSDVNPPEGYHLQVDGKGAPGFVRGEGDLRLESEGDSTLLHYSGDAQVGGRLASVGQRLMESSAQALIRQSLESLEAQIKARMQVGESGEEFVAPEAPSQIQFAAGVTRKMIEDALPDEQRQELIRLGLIAVFALSVFWLITNWWINRFAHRVADIMEERG